MCANLLDCKWCKLTMFWHSLCSLMVCPPLCWSLRPCGEKPWWSAEQSSEIDHAGQVSFWHYRVSPTGTATHHLREGRCNEWFIACHVIQPLLSSGEPWNLAMMWYTSVTWSLMQWLCCDFLAFPRHVPTETKTPTPPGQLLWVFYDVLLCFIDILRTFMNCFDINRIYWRWFEIYMLWTATIWWYDMHRHSRDHSWFPRE